MKLIKGSAQFSDDASKLDDLRSQLKVAKRQLRESRRMVDGLMALTIGTCLMIGVHVYQSAPRSPGNGARGNVITCEVKESGDLACPVSFEELKNYHVDLMIPITINPLSLLKAEDLILINKPKTLRKIIKNERCEN